MRLALSAAAALGLFASSPALAQSGGVGSGSLTDQLVGPAPAPLVFPRPSEPDPTLTRPVREPQPRAADPSAGTTPASPTQSAAPAARPEPRNGPAGRQAPPAPQRGRRAPVEAAAPPSEPRPAQAGTAAPVGTAAPDGATADHAAPGPAIAGAHPEARPGKQAEDRFEMVTRRQNELGKRLQRSICSNC